MGNIGQISQFRMDFRFKIDSVELYKPFLWFFLKNPQFSIEPCIWLIGRRDGTISQCAITCVITSVMLKNMLHLVICIIWNKSHFHNFERFKVGRFFAMVISSELLHSNHPLRPRANHHREEAPDFSKSATIKKMRQTLFIFFTFFHGSVLAKSQSLLLVNSFKVKN